MTLLTSLAAPLVPLAQGPLGPTLLVLVAAGLLTREIARASTPEGRLPAWTRAPIGRADPPRSRPVGRASGPPGGPGSRLTDKGWKGDSGDECALRESGHDGRGT